MDFEIGRKSHKAGGLLSATSLHYAPNALNKHLAELTGDSFVGMAPMDSKTLPGCLWAAVLEVTKGCLVLP